jgi:hypothetical protein
MPKVRKEDVGDGNAEKMTAAFQKFWPKDPVCPSVRWREVDGRYDVR